MLSYSTASLLSFVSLALAQTPNGIFPQVNFNLAVSLQGNNNDNLNNGNNGQFLGVGQNVDFQSVQQVPQIGIRRSETSNNQNQRFLMMLLDVDSVNGQQKREAQNPPAPAPGVAQAPQQPDDAEHSGGRNTFLNAMISDYQFSNQNNNNNNNGQQELLQAPSNNPISWLAPNPNDGRQHRYMMILFEQPQNFNVPAQMQQMAQNRQNFDLREFMQQCNLPLPQWGTYFIVTNGNGVNNGNNGGGFNNGNGNGNQQSYITTFTTTTTFPNGGPTQTFLTVSTAFGNPNNGNNGNNGGFNNGGNNGNNGNSNGGFNNGGNNNGGFQNGGGFNGGIGFDPSIIYSTGFQGLRTTTSSGRTQVQTYTTLPDGRISSGNTNVETTVTRTISGVSRVSPTTYQTTSFGTRTNFQNGQLTTEFFSSVGQVTQSIPIFNGRAAPQLLNMEQALLGVAGAVLAWL